MTSSITLYGFPLSGHSHRVELLLSLLELPFNNVTVDLTKGAHKAADYLAKNALGQVPVLEDGDLTLSDSNAIMVYLALRYDKSGRWYPREPVAAAQVQRWLSIAAGQLVSGPGALRVAALFRRPLERAHPEALAKQVFTLMETTLTSSPWLTGNEPTLADLASYAYTAHAPEGGISLEPYPAVRAWVARVQALPGFVAMPSAPKS